MGHLALAQSKCEVEMPLAFQKGTVLVVDGRCLAQSAAAT